jgi:3-oxoadipate enol-lactonase
LGPKWIDVGGRSLRYELSGEGPLVVLVHEMGGSLNSWDAVVPRLAGRFTVLRFDWRGFGLSEKIRGEVSLRDLSGDLDGLIGGLGLDTPAIVAGCAVGGGISLGLAAWWPERVAGLVLFSPSLGIPPEGREDRLAMARSVEASGMRVIAEGSIGNGYPEKFRARDPERFAAFCGRWFANDPHSFAAVLRMLTHLDIDPVLAAIECPTLCVGCTLDPFRPPAVVEAVAGKIAGAGFTSIESGHHSPAITPDLVADTILGFCNAIASHTRGGAPA